MKSKKQIENQVDETLTPEQWSEITQQFGQLLDLPPEKRESFLENLTHLDPAIKREIRCLLDVENAAGDFLENPVAKRMAKSFEKSNLNPVFNSGEKILDYEIIKLLGTGAFASVYLAKELSLNRLVALKVSRQTTDEAKTLAHLDHPHIVKIFSGEPDTKNKLNVIAMQFIPGLTLNQIKESFKTEAGNKFLKGQDLLNLLSGLVGKEDGVNPKEVYERNQISELDATNTIFRFRNRGVSGPRVCARPGSLSFRYQA